MSEWRRRLIRESQSAPSPLVQDATSQCANVHVFFFPSLMQFSIPPDPIRQLFLSSLFSSFLVRTLNWRWKHLRRNFCAQLLDCGWVDDGKRFNENCYVAEDDSDYLEWLREQQAKHRKGKGGKQVRFRAYAVVQYTQHVWHPVDSITNRSMPCKN